MSLLAEIFEKVSYVAGGGGLAAALVGWLRDRGRVAMRERALAFRAVRMAVKELRTTCEDLNGKVVRLEEEVADCVDDRRKLHESNESLEREVADIRTRFGAPPLAPAP